MKKNKFNLNLFITFLQLIAFLIIVFFLIKITLWHKNSLVDKKNNESLTNEVIIVNNDINNSKKEKIKENNALNQEEFTIDFDKLKEINTDIIGWIKINNTNINYPVLQSKDNDFYLHRNFKKEYSQAGSIFLNANNNMFLDKNTIIYGHNMNDNTMFHDLFKLYNNELGNNIEIEIYTENDKSTYKVISTYIDFPENLTYNYEFNSLISKSNINFDLNNINTEKLLTLYTCNFLGDKRLIVHAAKINLN